MEDDLPEAKCRHQAAPRAKALGTQRQNVTGQPASRDQLFTTKISTKALAVTKPNLRQPLLPEEPAPIQTAALLESKVAKKVEIHIVVVGVELTQNRREGMRGAPGLRRTRRP